MFDFFCHELALAIEIDGNSHDRENAYEKDIERQREIERLGIQFFRFNDLDVKRNMIGVLSVIEQWIKEHTPDPSQEGNHTSEYLRQAQGAQIALKSYYRASSSIF